MKKYDYKKAIEIMKEEKVKTASLGMNEDWYWTGDEVTITKLKKMKNGITRFAGIVGSDWATPVLKIENGDWTKTIDCYYED